MKSESLNQPDIDALKKSLKEVGKGYATMGFLAKTMNCSEAKTVWLLGQLEDIIDEAWIFHTSNDKPCASKGFRLKQKATKEMKVYCVVNNYAHTEEIYDTKEKARDHIENMGKEGYWEVRELEVK